jgi:flagellar basal-body rod modification protein FlgD
MDLSQLNSIAPSGTSAANTVASALSSRRAVQATPKAATSSTNGTTTSNSSSAASNSNITANDFLTLLVSELKNQDPTQPTDPNQYITQLAQVNSLQQLISINQGIGTLNTTISAPSSSSSGSSGSNTNANVVAAVADANTVSGSQGVPGQNAIWGGLAGSTAS